MSYLSVANGNVVFLLCGIVILFVLLQAVVFMKKAWQRGMELNMSKEVMVKVIRNSMIFSVIPTLPILIVLLILMPSLGRYFPWLRLSVVGSGVYENMAADLTAKAFGLSGVADKGFSLEIFISAMWVMTIGIIWGPLYTALGSKHIQKGLAIIKGKHEKSFQAIFASMFIAMLAVFAAPYLSTPFKVATGENPNGIVGIVPLLVLLVAAFCTWGIDRISQKSGIKALSEFSFSISLVIGMLSAILFQIILS